MKFFRALKKLLEPFGIKSTARMVGEPTEKSHRFARGGQEEEDKELRKT